MVPFDEPSKLIKINAFCFEQSRVTEFIAPLSLRERRPRCVAESQSLTTLMIHTGTALRVLTEVTFRGSALNAFVAPASVKVISAVCFRS
jgi:hypothetical protein